MAEYPSWGALNRPIPLSGSPSESELITSARPFYIPDVAQAAQLLGPVQNTLLSLDIDALLLVPVQVDGRVFGSFSLDVSGRTRPFTLREITLCQRFADQVGQAILRSGKSVPKTKETLPQAIDEQQIARTIVTQAVTLLGANGGGLYRYQPSHNMLSLIATYDQNDTQLNGVTLAIGEGAAGHLIASEKPYLIIPNYEQWGQRARVYEGKYFFGAVVEVPLRHADNIIGVLFVNDMVGRQFTTEDAHLLQLFADQAATAWYHAQLSTLDAARLHRLEILTQASATIMRMLGRVSVPDLLQQIAHHGADILQAEACSVLLVKQPGFLTFVAGHGYDADKLPLGREFAIRSGPGTGLTGHIADKGLLFNEHGATLLQHPAVSGKETPLVASGHCYAMLGLPLQHEGKLVGLLRVENKKNERGEVDPLLPFDQQDEWILRLLADAILVAIDNATLMDEMDIEKEHLTRLLQNVPSAVVANDLNGRIFS
ncbi:MAG: GAF domain-containing protein [bacterium]|nr:GAF domain-containing protein [bacterium]